LKLLGDRLEFQSGRRVIPKAYLASLALESTLLPRAFLFLAIAFPPLFVVVQLFSEKTLVKDACRRRPYMDNETQSRV
jgi:hypothetical protein